MIVMPTINRPKKKSNYDSQKKIAQKYVYNTPAWKSLRLTKLASYPICEQCLFDEQRISPAVQVHHITPFMRGVTIEQIKFLGFDFDNLQSLCEECHLKKHK